MNSSSSSTKRSSDAKKKKKKKKTTLSGSSASAAAKTLYDFESNTKSSSVETNNNEGAMPLPKREGDAFNAALIEYENRRFKEALTSIEKILKKFPNHGETLCMKGLVVRHHVEPMMKKKKDWKNTEEERRMRAHDLVSRGVKNHVGSHVCWHVYGLLHKADRNYKEASKCYSQALKIDPGNWLVWRDLAQARLMSREMNEYVDARKKMFELKMGQPGSSDRANQIVIGLYASEKWEE